MKKLLVQLIFLGFASGLLADSSTKASWSDNLTVNASVGFESEYVSHGWNLAHDITVSAIGLDYKLYRGTLYLNAVDKSMVGAQDAGIKAAIGGNVAEFATGYKMPVYDRFTVDAGFFDYWFDQQDYTPTWREIYTGVSYKGLYVNPSAYLYYDFDREGFYYELSGSHSYPLAKFGLQKTALCLSATVGGMDMRNALTDSGNAYLGVSKLNDSYMYYMAAADLVYSLTKNSTASVGIRYGGNTDGGVNGGGANDALVDRENSFWWGAKFATKF